MDQADILKQSDKELSELIRTSRTKLGQLRFHVAADQHTDVRDVRDLRRTIARALTEQGRRKRQPIKPS